MEFINKLDGYVLYVYNNGKVTEEIKGYCETKPNKVLTTKDTYYDIASLTKTYTAIIVFMAYEEGLLGLDDLVTNYDSDYINLDKITIRDLLCHNQDIWTEGYLGDAKDSDEFKKILHSAYVKYEKPTYEDTHYIILGQLLEGIYGKTLDKIVEEKIINRLGLKHTTYNPSGLIASMNYYNDEGGDLKPGELHDKKARLLKKIGITCGHAGLFTNGEDLLIFLEAILNNVFVKEETTKIMIEHHDINKLNVEKGYGSRSYTYMGARYFNDIEELNDVPYKKEGLLSFSGYTGPRYLIDFEGKIIIVLMANIIHNRVMTRDEKNYLMKHVVYEIYDEVR